MDAFSAKLEDLEVMERTIGDTLDESAAKMTNQDEVNSYDLFFRCCVDAYCISSQNNARLIQEVADENNLQLKELLPDLVAQQEAQKQRLQAQKQPSGVSSAPAAAAKSAIKS